jgi:hypothetical protein
MGIVHDISEHLWTRPFRTKVAPFVIIMAPIMQVPHTLLGLRAVLTWVMPPIGLRF